MPKWSWAFCQLTGRSPNDLSRRGLIALISALAILLVIDRIVAFTVDTAKINAFLPDVEILLFCVIAWVVFTYMATTRFYQRKKKEEPSPRPKRRPERQTDRHQARDYIPPPKGSVLHTPRATSKGPWRSTSESEQERPAPQRLMSLARWNEELEKTAAAKDPEETEALLRQMRKTGAVPGTEAYNAVILSCTGAGSMPRAEKWQEYMSLVGVDADSATFRILLDGYVQAGDMQAADGCISRMRQAGLSPDEDSYATLVQAHIRNGSKAVAKKWLEEMVERGLKPATVPHSIVVDLGHPEWGDSAS